MARPQRLSALAVVVLALLAPRGRAHRLDKTAQEEAASEAINSGGTTLGGLNPYGLDAAHAFHGPPAALPLLRHDQRLLSGVPQIVQTHPFRASLRLGMTGSDLPVGGNQANDPDSMMMGTPVEYFSHIEPEPVGPKEMQLQQLYKQLTKPHHEQPFDVQLDTQSDVDFVKRLGFDLTEKDGFFTVQGLSPDTRLRLFKEVVEAMDGLSYGNTVQETKAINYQKLLSESEKEFVESLAGILGMHIYEGEDKSFSASVRCTGLDCVTWKNNFKFWQRSVVMGLTDLMQGKTTNMGWQLTTEERVKYVKMLCDRLCLYYTEKDKGLERILIIGGPDDKKIEFMGLPRSDEVLQAQD